MAYLTIDRNRFRFLLRFGIDGEELKRFFIDNRSPLILKGAKVQNLPRGPAEAVSTLLNLPTSADHLLQKWFSTNISIINPEPVDELLETFQLYEDLAESLPGDDARRLSRSCLVHLFSADPPVKLIEFLKSPIGNGELDQDHDLEPDKESLSEQSQGATNDSTFLTPEFALALVTLLEGKNPEEQLSNLPPVIASFLHGLYVIKEGYSEEAKIALDDLSELEQVKSILSEYADRLAKIKDSSRPTPSGIQQMRFEEVDDPEFDFDSDQVLGICTKDSPETAVFIQPFAIRTWNGKLLSLERQETREFLFPKSGDVQAFPGRNYPKQPTRNEIGLWYIAPNDTYATAAHRNNFHLKSTKTEIYEVQLVPFFGSNYDSVREFIKQTILARAGKKQLDPLLFLLRDDLIVGCPPGKDLTRDDGFDEGLPCWRALSAFRFEGRMLVPGPLPAYEKYECATLASTLKKFFSSKKADAEKLTKAQQKNLLDSVNSEEAHLNASRQARLLEDLKYIEADDGAIGLLLEEAMKDEKIAARIELLIKEKVDEQTGENSALIHELRLLEKQRNELRENIAKQEKEQRALPPSVSKAIKDSIKKAKDDVFGTLGQIVVFKALMEESGGSTNPASALGDSSSLSMFRTAEHDATSFLDALKTLGVSAKHAKALEMTGEAVFRAGMILVIEGIAARLAAEAWGRKDESGCILLDCTIGLTDDAPFKGIALGETRSTVILDANLSPLELYARPLIDLVQRRITKPGHVRSPRIVMSLSDGVASLPLSRNIEALAVRISLNDKPDFIREDDVAAELDDIQDADAGEAWASRLWRPSLNALLHYLKDIPTEDAALVLSVLKLGRA